MDKDPLENFAEQLASWESLEGHAAALAAKARVILASDPDAKLVGVVLQPDAPEGRELFAHRERSGGQAGTEIAEVMHREEVLRVLRSNATGSLDWFPAHDPGRTTLPLASFMRHGVRFGVTPMAAPPAGSGRARVRMAHLTAEQHRIGEAIRGCAAHLLEVLAATRRDHPEIDPIGVIVEPGSPQRAALLAASGHADDLPAAEGLVTLMRRSEVAAVLAADHRLPAIELPVIGPGPSALPVVLFARDGCYVATLTRP